MSRQSRSVVYWYKPAGPEDAGSLIVHALVVASALVANVVEFAPVARSPAQALIVVSAHFLGLPEVAAVLGFGPWLGGPVG